MSKVRPVYKFLWDRPFIENGSFDVKIDSSCLVFYNFFSSDACCELWDEKNKQCKGTSIIIGLTV